MLNAVLRTVLRLQLLLRYRVTVRGLERIVRRGTRGILFLPNHPALIDPVIVVSHLHARFQPRPLADEDQIDAPGVRWLTARVGVIPIPDIKVHGTAVRDQVEAAAEVCAAALRAGQNVVLYPSGHIYRTRFENLRGNSGVEAILRKVPEARVVAVRTRGLWGSSLSLVTGEFPDLARWPLGQLANLLRSYLFFMPRRRVTVDLHEFTDLPTPPDRRVLNPLLEQYYNEDAPPATFVPYHMGTDPRPRELSDPQWAAPSAALANVPVATRERVEAHLRELTGVAQMADEDTLANDLGLDSLARADLLLWLTQEFGHADQDADALQTVGDVMLAACGQAMAARPVSINPPPKAWFVGDPNRRLRVASGSTITEVFLRQARQNPNQIVIADQRSRAKSYRDIVTAVLALKPELEQLAGERIGIMLPASVGATIVYIAALFARKTPVMVNWTTGARNIHHSLDVAGVQHVLTATALLTRLQSQGVDLKSIEERITRLEDIGARITWRRKLSAALRGYTNWGELDRVSPPETAVVLVTSGSESLPKAVPLTHANILTNVRDTLDVVDIRQTDRMIGFLPPFHSFGLTVTVVAPLVTGFPVSYHANPTEGHLLAHLIKAYGSTVVLGTPTFLNGILRAASTRLLSSLRLAVTGAEKCPEHVYEAFARLCPGATVLEGYGITECSPIVSVNRPEHARPGTIGQPLPSIEHVLLDVDSNEPVTRDKQGLLLVRGPSIFDGYLGDDVASPFVEHDGLQWYRTGDLVSEDADDVLTFRGRLKRFVKLGGEMISLPAIEAALLTHYAREDDDGPSLAVAATPDEARPELVLFTTRPVDRSEANAHIRNTGLSALHNLSRIEYVDEIPLLGNGKTDYRALQSRLNEM